MNMNEYQQEAAKTAIYPTGNFAYLALGLNGEAGEVAEIVKRAIRSARDIDGDDHLLLQKELGDCLWYIANLAREAGFTLSSVADENLTKLRSRQERGAIEGRGNNR